ncbi:MAG: 3-oxoacyl-ACP synthase III [Planctomycetota bacterium]
MRYTHVRLAGLGHTLPDEVVASSELESRLAPLYQRLRLPEGRLELMSGIRERRFFVVGARPSDLSVPSARRAIEASSLAPSDFGCLIHGSVCRDFLEPATACRVHHELGLPAECLAFDVSNACLGVMTGVAIIASMIEQGQIAAGVAVGSELGRGLVENSIARLNSDESITRESLKPWFASLTIGSASVAVVLCHEDLLAKRGPGLAARLVSSTAHAATESHHLCQSEGLAEVMQTDSEALMRAGIDAGATTFQRFLAESEWSCDQIDKTVCHQVGGAHRQMMLDRLGLSPERDFATLQWLGNTGAAALPVSLALGAEEGWFQTGDRVGLLGIGSGVNCLMMGVEWS